MLFCSSREEKNVMMANNKLVDDEQHLIEDIVSRLPVESVLRCRCVCKRWRALLHEPHFTQMHADRALQQQQRLLLDDDDDDDDNPRTKHPCDCDSSSSSPVSFFNWVYFPLPGTPNDQMRQHAHYAVHLDDYYIKYAADDDYEQLCINNKKKMNNSSGSSYVKVRRQLQNPAPPLRRTGQTGRGGIDINASHGWLILGSCNGLICLYDDNCITADSYIIYNPITKECLNLRGDVGSLPINNTAYYEHMAYGFGYHPSTKDYKIVKIIYNYMEMKKNERWRVQIYTLGTGGKWRIKKQVAYHHREKYPWFYLSNCRGVSVNGAIYWITGVLRDQTCIYFDSVPVQEKTKVNIISFDLANEKLKRIPSPPSRSSSDVRYDLPFHLINELGVLEQRLCMFQHATLSTDIWVMNHNNNYDIGSSGDDQYWWNDGGDDDEYYRWSKKFSIPVSNPAHTVYEPIGITMRGAVLCFRDNNYLISFDEKTKTFESMGKVCLLDAIFRISYKKSFVSLKALGEENAEIVKSIVVVAPAANAN